MPARSIALLVIVSLSAISACQRGDATVRPDPSASSAIPGETPEALQVSEVDGPAAASREDAPASEPAQESADAAIAETGELEKRATEESGPEESAPEESPVVASRTAPAAPESDDADVPSAAAVEPAAEPEPAPKTEPEAALPPECATRLERIREIRARIPLVFVDLQRTKEEIEADILEAIELGEEALGSCEGTSAEPLVAAWLGRDYLRRVRRHEESFRETLRREMQQSGLPRSELEQELQAVVKDEMERYSRRMRALTERALEAEPGSEARRQALLLAADLSQRDRDFERQIAMVRSLLAEYKEGEHVSKYLTDVGQALLILARYEEAVEWLSSVADERRDEEAYAAYNTVLLDALTGAGDLEGMETLLRRKLEEYPDRIARTTSSYHRDLYERWIDIAPFHLGEVRYALGDVEGALEWMRQGAARLEEKQGRLTSRGETLPVIQRVYLAQRYKNVLEFLEERQGTSPQVGATCVGKIEAADFTSDVRWVSDERLTLPEATGKVVAVLFRLPRDRRSQAFLLDLDAIARELDSVVGLTLGFFPTRVGQSELDARVVKMRTELAELGVELRAGFDEAPNQCLFRSLQATVGTATFVVFDKKGRYAWFLPDPDDLDRRIMKRVLTRLASQE